MGASKTNTGQELESEKEREGEREKEKKNTFKPKSPFLVFVFEKGPRM